MSVKRSQKSIIVLLIFSVSLIIATSVVTIFYWPQNNMNKEIKITINHGESLSNISKKLLKKGVITNDKIFEMATKIRGLDTSIPVGTFLMKNVKVNHDIINHLVFGNPERKRVTLLEGWNIRQTSNHLSKEMGFDYNDIVEIVNNTSFINGLGIKSESLEGYLYPDTYYFFEGDTPRSVLTRLVKEYKKFWTDEMYSQAREMQMSEQDVVTLASIIEGEAVYDAERSVISAVYHNRLKRI